MPDISRVLQYTVAKNPVFDIKPKNNIDHNKPI